MSCMSALVLLAWAPNVAAEYPAPKEGDWLIRDFRFHTGETLPELRLHYTTVGDRSGIPVLLLHATTGSGAGFFREDFAGELFGPGQALDATRYFIIIPDAVGAGQSSKPSDGLRTRFPRYTYEDVIRAQYRLLTEHLGVRHLRLVLGQSAGGMQTWLWGEMHPDFMDALMPLASLPVAMSGRNWIMRRMLIDAIRNDPAWNDGNYAPQPPSFRAAMVYFGLATGGGTRALYAAAPTRAQADDLINQRLAQTTNRDANDVLYAYEASRDYDPSPQLARVQAAVLAVNSEDDERNPAELGVLAREIKRVKRGRYILIPASEQLARGHAAMARQARHSGGRMISQNCCNRRRLQPTAAPLFAERRGSARIVTPTAAQFQGPYKSSWLDRR
jgi:homoserine O-acetyltransferase